jgi:lipid-binding SYLF domain-containing protein
MQAMRAPRCCVALLALALLAGCVWQPVAYTLDDRVAVKEAEAAFRADPRLQRFFDEAVAHAILPLSVRGGTGFGGALGSGWLFEGGEAVGKVLLYEVFAGVDLGGQGYRQVIFFRTAEALATFKKSRLEFTGQANAAFTVVGATATPAWREDVAVFTQVIAGLLLEASVGGQHYEYLPLPGAGTGE